MVLHCNGDRRLQSVFPPLLLTNPTHNNPVMTCGYAARYLSAKKPDSLPLYVAQTLLILLPPSLYAATIYMIYGRIVIFVNAPDASVIGPGKVTKIFVTGDVISFLIQAAGGAMLAQAGHEDLGKKVVLTGLFCQLLFFGFFLIIAIIFDRRMAKSSMRYGIPKYGKYSWKALLRLLFVAATIIIARCCYRVVSFAGGSKGTLMSHEVWMYVGDTAPMFVVQTLFLFIHAGNVFPRGGVQKDLRLDESYITLNRV
ncbi:RTA1 like protein [Hyaloscypha variabilis]|jgi:hypothetical protein